jgi:predicted RNA binding protein YcfA (HicA-like mRNA interferase family)
VLSRSLEYSAGGGGFIRVGWLAESVPCYDSPVKVREVIRLLKADGWWLVATEGSHRQFKHPTKPGRVTVSGHLGDDMPKGTLASVRRQAGLKELR